MTTVDVFLTNCRLADGRLVDIGVADRKIVIVGEGAAPASSNSAPALDIGGDLVLPGWSMAVLSISASPTGRSLLSAKALRRHRRTALRHSISAATSYCRGWSMATCISTRR